MLHNNIRGFVDHIPIGLFAIAALLVHPLAMVLVGVSFLVYEVVELYVLNTLCRLVEALDRAYPEIAGFIAGLLIGSAVLYGFFLMGVEIPFLWV